MGTRLIIEGNAVYEIDEDCQTCGKRQDTDTVRNEECRWEKEGKDKKKEP